MGVIISVILKWREVKIIMKTSIFKRAAFTAAALTVTALSVGASAASAATVCNQAQPGQCVNTSIQSGSVSAVITNPGTDSKVRVFVAPTFVGVNVNGTQFFVNR